MKQVTCLAWVPRGIPALKPRKAELNSNQLGDWEDTKSDALTNMSSEDERFSDSDDTCADLENSGDAENAIKVYNEAEDSYYPHHHYMLEEAPLCIEHVIFNKDTRDKGNFCAVGTMDSAIELWNLDVVEAIEPVAIFGIRNQSSETEKKKAKKISHENGVLSLTWNRILSHILASGSADFQIILWDIENQLGSAVLSGHSDKVQSIKWHPTESSRLLSGDTSGVVKLWDARESVCEKEWNEFNAEIERVAWNPWKSENFFVAASDGRLYNIDIRSGIVDVTEAHNGAVLDEESVAACGGENGCKIVSWNIGSAA
ncbi:putative WD domain, G-beta repeat protein [Trichinella nativa]|uniref:Putative WD domain, G-beta repeat protein n=1 Tax=Trichinella nativa TaxID=6335 RepID=A0A1Y3EYA2_9BILA|nr:putative WD domain, G-beta repeat protein [Trichinella nativa]